MNFRLPLPACCRGCGKRKREFGGRQQDCREPGSTSGKAIALVGLGDAAGGGEGGRSLVEAGGADAAHAAQLGEGKRADRPGERCCDALVDRGWRGCLRRARFDHRERQGIGALREFERDGGDGGSGAVLDRESELIAVAAEIEVGVAPGMEFGGSARGLAGADVAGALLGVVDDDDGDAVAALQLAQIGEQRRDLAAGVLVDAMQAYEGIEQDPKITPSSPTLLTTAPRATKARDGR
jgi:hypothetical protein